LIEKAVSFWRTAGQRSLARSTLLEGAEQLKRALDQIATLPATPTLRREEIKIQLAFGNALTLMGHFVDGKEHFDLALAIYDPAKHRPLTTQSGREKLDALIARGYLAADERERRGPRKTQAGHRGVTLIFYEMGEPSLSKFFAHSETRETFVSQRERMKFANPCKEFF
jgi:hypothetical protein